MSVLVGSSYGGQTKFGGGRVACVRVACVRGSARKRLFLPGSMLNPNGSSTKASYLDAYKRARGVTYDDLRQQKLLTDRGAYMTFLEEKVTRLTASLMTVQGFDERIESFQSQVNVMEDKIANVARIVRRNVRAVQDQEVSLDDSVSLVRFNERLEVAEDSLHTLQRGHKEFQQDKFARAQRDKEWEDRFKTFRQLTEERLSSEEKQRLFKEEVWEKKQSALFEELHGLHEAQHNTFQEDLRREREASDGSLRKEMEAQYSGLLQALKHERERDLNEYKRDLQQAQQEFNAKQEEKFALAQEKMRADMQKEFLSFKHSMDQARVVEQSSHKDEIALTLVSMQAQIDNATDVLKQSLEHSLHTQKELIESDNKRTYDKIARRLNDQYSQMERTISTQNEEVGAKLDQATQQIKREHEAMSRATLARTTQYEHRLVESAAQHTRLTQDMEKLRAAVAASQEFCASQTQDSARVQNEAFNQYEEKMERLLRERDQKVKDELRQSFAIELSDREKHVRSERETMETKSKQRLKDISDDFNRELRLVKEEQTRVFREYKNDTERGLRDLERGMKEQEEYTLQQLGDYKRSTEQDKHEQAEDLRKEMETLRLDTKRDVHAAIAAMQNSKGKEMKGNVQRLESELQKKSRAMEKELAAAGVEQGNMFRERLENLQMTVEQRFRLLENDQSALTKRVEGSETRQALQLSATEKEHEGHTKKINMAVLDRMETLTQEMTQKVQAADTKVVRLEERWKTARERDALEWSQMRKQNEALLAKIDQVHPIVREEIEELRKDAGVMRTLVERGSEDSQARLQETQTEVKTTMERAQRTWRETLDARLSAERAHAEKARAGIAEEARANDRERKDADNTQVREHTRVMAELRREHDDLAHEFSQFREIQEKYGRTERGTAAARMDGMDAKVREMEDRWRDAKAGLRAGKERGDKDVSKRLKLLEETIDAKYLGLQKTLNQVVLEQQMLLTRLEETDSNEGVEEEGESTLNISSSSVEGRLSSSFVKAQTNVMEGYRDEVFTKLKRMEEKLGQRIGELEETLEVATVELETEQSALGRKFDDWAADQHVRRAKDSSDAQAIESSLRTDLTRAKEEMARKVDDIHHTVRSVEAALRAEWSTWRDVAATDSTPVRIEDVETAVAGERTRAESVEKALETRVSLLQEQVEHGHVAELPREPHAARTSLNKKERLAESLMRMTMEGSGTHEEDQDLIGLVRVQENMQARVGRRWGMDASGIGLRGGDPTRQKEQPVVPEKPYAVQGQVTAPRPPTVVVKRLRKKGAVANVLDSELDTVLDEIGRVHGMVTQTNEQFRELQRRLAEKKRRKKKKSVKKGLPGSVTSRSGARVEEGIPRWS